MEIHGGLEHARPDPAIVGGGTESIIVPHVVNIAHDPRSYRGQFNVEHFAVGKCDFDPPTSGGTRVVLNVRDQVYFLCKMHRAAFGDEAEGLYGIRTGIV